MITHGGAFVVTKEVVFLSVTRSEQVKHGRVRVVANRSQNHVVPFLHGTETNIFHSLDKGQSAPVCLFGLFLEMCVQGVLVVNVVASPELH